jgi:hypothetical protein
MLRLSFSSVPHFLTMAKSTIDTTSLESAELLSGPHTLFHASFTVAFLVPPPELSATVLLRATYVGENQALGKKHPQSPPLHLHFDQAESFIVVKGVSWFFCMRAEAGLTAMCV